MNTLMHPFRAFAALSFRNKLIAGNIAILTVAILAIGIISIRLTARSTNYLSTQLNTSERERAESTLSNSTKSYAHDLDAFFTYTENAMENLGLSMEGILGRESLLVNEGAWDARMRLTQLPSGSWDNDNVESGSIFLPIGVTPERIYSEVNALKQLDARAPRLMELNPDVVAVYFGSVKGETIYYPNVDLANLLPPDFDITQRTWYIAAAPAQNLEKKIVWSAPYVDAANNGVVITSSTPIIDDFAIFRGVIAMDIQLTSITELINTIRVGETGYAFLIDKEGHVIAMPEMGYADFGLSAADFQAESYLEKSLLSEVNMDLFGILAKMTSSQDGIVITTLNNTEKYIAYHPIPSVGYSLGIVVDVSETQRNVLRAEEQLAVDSRRTIFNLTGIMAAVWLIFLLTSQQLGTALTRPLAALTASARLIARGELVNIPATDATDEVGLLSNTLSTMTKNLRATIGVTEQRVTERTAELRQAVAESDKRAQELKTISEVARAISTEIELENLLNLVTYMVSERFGFYHVGVFLIDTVTKFAILRAANSPGGKRMLERGHKLEVGQEGIVGYVTGAGEARIALNVGEDAIYFSNPDMPNTRSEMALPLKLRGRIIGALDVQSTEANAFTKDDIETLGVLADQIAIAIDNARLFAETQRSLTEVQSLYGDYVGRTWNKKTIKSPIGYHHSTSGGQTLMEPVNWDEAQDALAMGKTLVTAGQAEAAGNVSAVAVPIRLYNQTIGVIDIRSANPERKWKEDEIAVIEAVAERLGLALENARLFEETSARASREHSVAEISSRIRSTNDPQAMIRIAVEELQRVLNVTRVEIVPQVVPPQNAGTERAS